MNRSTVFIYLALFSVSVFAKDPDLIGFWNISQEIVDKDDVYKQETSSFVVTEQNGDFFKGHACPQDLDRTDLYGILDGRKVYVTAWDSLSFATINGLGTEITGISLRQDYDEDQGRNDSSSAKVVATKVDSTPTCP